MSTNTATIPATAHDAHGNTVVVGSAAGGGISPADTTDWLQRVQRDGHAVTYVPALTPTAHRVSGCGIAHNDAAFAERRDGDGSMAAYYENGEAFGGRWWENADQHGYHVGVNHYGITDPHAGSRRTRDAASAALAAAGRAS